ncbi:MAG: putative lipid II flippase FtsW [Acidimicrobiia bacterium]
MSTVVAPRAVAGQPDRTFWGMFFAFVGLLCFGFVMVLSSSSIVALNRGESPWTMFLKQLLWACIGLVVGLCFYRMPYANWRRYVTANLVGAWVAMLLPFVPGLGLTINGAKAWVSVGPVGFQPSEYLKLAVLLYCANLLGRRHAEITDVRRTFVPPMIVLVVSVLLCLAQNDLGASIIIATIVLIVMFMAGTPLRLVVATAAAGVLGALLVALTGAARRARFTAFLNLEETKGHYGYQVWQSILSISNGGISGVGVGEGTGKWGYVPLAHSDFIFSTIAEEFGVIGVVVVLGCFLVIAILGLRIALGARERFGALLGGGIAMWFCVQAIVNVGGVTGTMPVTGLTLPLISYGGSSLAVCMAAAGLMLNVARNMR